MEVLENTSDTVNFWSKFDGVNKSLIEGIGNKRYDTFRIVEYRHYGDVINSIIKNYGFLATGNEELEQMRLDGGKGIKTAALRIRRHSHYINEHKPALEITPIMMTYIYFYMVVQRANPDYYNRLIADLENEESTQNIGIFDIETVIENIKGLISEELYKMLEQANKYAYRDKSQDVLNCWNDILDTFDHIFDVKREKQNPAPQLYK